MRLQAQWFKIVQDFAVDLGDHAISNKWNYFPPFQKKGGEFQFVFRSNVTFPSTPEVYSSDESTQSLQQLSLYVVTVENHTAKYNIGHLI